MQGKRDGEITRLLGAFSNGEPEAEARLMDLTYRELRKIAAGHMRRERSARSLQTSDLVHEAYLRLVDQAATPWRDRAHFFSGGRACHAPDPDRPRPQAPRRQARRRCSRDQSRSALDIAEAHSGDLLVLEEALAQLQKVDGRQCQVVEMRLDRKSTRLNSSHLGIS